MKNVIFICLLTLTYLSVSAIGNFNGPGEKGAAITFEKTTIDYGKIKKGSEPRRIFSFTNSGDEPLLITNAKGSCGCSVPTYPTEAIAPGASSEIEVRYDTKRIGMINKSITISSNAGDPIILHITGEVIDLD